MVTVAGRPLIEWLVRTARSAGIDDLVVVTGYRAEMIENLIGGDVTTYHNPDFETTEMVESLWCAAEALEGTVVISYSDILYTPAVLEAVLGAPHDVAVAVDEDWQSYWEARHEDPVDDAESLALDDQNRITSIGEPVERLDTPDGQYIGLVKLSSAGVKAFGAAAEPVVSGGSLGRRGGSGGTGSHMTDVLRRMVEDGVPVTGTPIRGDWIEIDTTADLELARSVCARADDGSLVIDR